MPEDGLCQNGRFCFMETFAEYWASRIHGKQCNNETQDTCPVPECQWDDTFAVCATTKTEDDYPGLESDDFQEELFNPTWVEYLSERQSVLIAAGRAHHVESERQETGMREDFAWIGYNATYPKYNTVEQANEWHRRWKDFHDKFAPTIGGIQTTEMYTFMVTQNEMVKAAILGVCLSLVVTCIVLLLVTCNWWVTGVGMLNLLAIVCVFLGLMPLIGWSLGQNECIFLMLLLDFQSTTQFTWCMSTIRRTVRIEKIVHSMR